MLRPHLGSKLFRAMLIYGVRCRTLSCEERYGRMIASPVKSTCTSTTPQLSERAGAAYNRRTTRLIPRSWLLEGCCEREDYVIRGGRLLSVLRRWRDLQKPDSIGVLSAFLGRGADRRWGFGASKVEGWEGDGQAFPITERHRVYIKFWCKTV